MCSIIFSSGAELFVAICCCNVLLQCFAAMFRSCLCFLPHHSKPHSVCAPYTAGHCHTIRNCHWTLLSPTIWVSGFALWSQSLPFMYLVTQVADSRWDCHGLPVEFEIDKKLSKQLVMHLVIRL